MQAHHDPFLVGLSVLVAICGGYSCFHLLDRLTRLLGSRWKTTLLAAGSAIGGGIWAMHFVAMSAMNLPIDISYDLQLTLLSALLAIGVTTIALYLVTLRRPTGIMVGIGGMFMGCGISAMHYVGMSAIRAPVHIQYDPAIVVLSVLVGVGASIMALFLAIHVRNRLHQVPAAVAMGCAIAGMHYTAMAAASFEPIIGTTAVQPVALDQGTMAVIVTIAAFILMGSTFFLAAPGPHQLRRYEMETTAAPDPTPMAPPAAQPEDRDAALEPDVRVPVKNGKRRTFLDPDEVICVDADSHYTKVSSDLGEFFCHLSMSDMDQRLQPLGFLRVHRSHLVNVERITGFSQTKSQGEVIVSINGKDRAVPVSRAKLEAVRHALNALNGNPARAASG